MTDGWAAPVHAHPVLYRAGRKTVVCAKSGTHAWLLLTDARTRLPLGLEPCDDDVVSVAFRVDGYMPPKKDGANSMWGKAGARTLLKALRTSAAEAMAGREPFDEPVELELTVRTGTVKATELWARRSGGDLDNFITGVCDGLQAAYPGWRMSEEWADVREAAQPDRPLVFTDDSWVRRIVAEAVTGEVGYEVRVRPLHQAASR